jgi:hypothetical protein
MKIKTTLLALTFFATAACVAQTSAKPKLAPRQLEAQRTSKPVKIDGRIDDEAWKDASIMTDLIEFRPTVGRLEEPETKTVTYLMYDEEGIYFGGFCYERTKDSIARELAGRDGFGTNDYIGLIFDTYNDKLNGFEYFVTPLGEQWDAKMSPDRGEDFTWSAVWESGAVIHDNGWSFEMFLPYSAIRFGKDEVQTWGLNITRRRRKTEQQYTWNPIDPNVSGFLTQEGLWTNIRNIKPPLRLQFSPYFSTYVNHYPFNTPGQKNWSSSVSGGMDIKYGINQAFTLDMTLIPDFGQVQSDNRVLNLSPFEVKYDERRPFFTEGTELFNKGNLFYPRRIGIQPVGAKGIGSFMNDEDRIIKNPAESKLINATKISGRTQKGLGIGVLNAVTNHRYGILENSNTKEQREVLMDPLTNYSVIVLDQTMKNNSSVSFVNTNVWRSGGAYDANVMAGLFSLNDKKNMWRVNGMVARSMLFGFNPDGSDRNGHSHSLGFGKTSGRWNFQVAHELTNKTYNSNDLGYFTINNTLDHYFWTGYRWNKPTKWYNSIYLNFNVNYSRQLSPASFRSANINANVNGQLKNLWYVGSYQGYEPEFNDFFESRTGRVFRGWSNYYIGGWFETNQAKKYNVYMELLWVDRSMFNSQRFQFNFQQRYRFSDKLSVTHNLNNEPQKRNVGYANHYLQDPITNSWYPTHYFGRRDRETVENTLSFKYSFNTMMNITTRIRHYWSNVKYDQLYYLKDDGGLLEVPDEPTTANQNYNFFTVDAVYTWQFAPGSFINIVWKNAAENYNAFFEKGYFKNFNNTMKTDDNNNLSLKVIYFLDYFQFRKGMKKKKSS